MTNPTEDHDPFLGWFTAPEGGVNAADLSDTEDTTLFARWGTRLPVSFANLANNATIFVPREPGGAFVFQISATPGIRHTWGLTDRTHSDIGSLMFTDQDITGTSFSIAEEHLWPMNQYTVYVRTNTSLEGLESVDIRSFDVLGVAIEPLSGPPTDPVSVPAGGLVVNVRSSNPVNTRLEWVLRDVTLYPNSPDNPFSEGTVFEGSSFVIPSSRFVEGHEYSLAVRATIRGGVPGEEMWDFAAFRATTRPSLITSEQMSSINWLGDISSANMARLNDALSRYNITDIRSIRLFLATCAHESGRGRWTLERLPLLWWVRYYEHDRGAGYMQLTHRGEHLSFLATVNDDFTGQNTAIHIADNWPWESAAWVWAGRASNLRSNIASSPNRLNNFVMEHGDSLKVFLLTQYAINGWMDGTPTHAPAAAILNGGEPDIRNNAVHVEGHGSFSLPIGWADRYAQYTAIMNTFA